MNDTIKEMFPDWGTMECGTWSCNNKLIPYGKRDNDVIEIGLYRESDGSYTLQVFNGDEIVICETVKEM